MNDDVWHAPGRADGSDGVPPGADRSQYRPAPGGAPGGGPAPHNPYASPAGAPPAGYPDPYAAHPGMGLGRSGTAPGRPGAGPGHPLTAPGHPGAPAGPYDAFATSDRHRERVLGSAGYTTPAYRNDSVAVTSLVLGIVGILIPGVFLLAILTGHIALRRLRRSYEGGRGLAVAGLVLGYVMLALWASVLLTVLSTRVMLGF